jgi:3-oxoacyl-[acyl-carrier protein] reductase
VDLSLRDKVAVVAASSQGIGRATAEEFAREGARVVVNGRHAESLRKAADQIAQETGATVDPVVGDVSKAEDCERLIASAVHRFGTIDALVTNAGGPPSRSFDDLGDDDWYSAFDLTLMSAVRLTRAALPHLRASRGAIVNITSTSVKQPIPNLVLSNSIRPGVVGLGKTLADELAPAGVRVNDVGPGQIWTARQEHLLSARAEREGLSLDEVVRRSESGVPLRRIGKPEDVARLIVFLCSAAAGYITGQTILVDGGSYRGLL